MHGSSNSTCPYTYPTSITQGDNYLSTLVPNILNSNTFKSDRVALFILFDEGTNFCPLNPGAKEDCVYAVWAGNSNVVKQKFASNNLYNDYSYLKTIETNWNLPSLTQNDAAATAMSEFFAGQSSVKLGSWNPNVPCSPILVSIEQVIGNQTNANGGALEAGSIFSPGVTNSTYGPSNVESWLTNSSVSPHPPNWKSPGPPCVITNSQGSIISAFVQIDGVVRDFPQNGTTATNFKPVNGLGSYPTGPQFSTRFNVLTPGYATSSSNCSNNPTSCMHGLSVTIDQDWKGAGFCGPYTACDETNGANGLRSHSTAYVTPLDVQGFVFWNSTSSTDPTHNYSGWELHALTAWRVSSSSTTDFSLSANPNALTIQPGSFKTANITIDASNLFTGSISLSRSVVRQTGAGPLPNVTMTPSQVTLPSAGKYVAFSTLNVTASSSTSGTYLVTISGVNSTLTRTTTVTITMVGFGLSATPPSQSIAAGQSASSTITVTSKAGFSGTVTLTAQSSCVCAFASLGSGSLFLPANGTATTNLQILTSQGQFGNATVTITGSSSSTPFTSSLSVTIRVYDFSVSPATQSFTTNAGSKITPTLVLASQNGFNGTVTFTVSSSPTGPTVNVIPTSFTLARGQTTAIQVSFNTTKTGTYTVTLIGTSGVLSHSVTIIVRVVDFNLTSPTPIQLNVGSTAKATITVTGLNGFTGTVSLTDIVPTGLTCGAFAPSNVVVNGTTTISCSASTVGNYDLAITGTGSSLQHTIHIIFNAVDFTVIAGPVFPSPINAGSIGSSTISVSGVNNFAGSVTFTEAVPSGLVCSMSPSSLLLPPNATAVLSCSSSTAGNYTVTVTGTNGGLVHTTALIPFHIVDFKLASSTGSLSLVAGSGTGLDSVTLTSLNGFNNTVTVSVSISPNGPSVQLQYVNVRVTPEGNSTALTINPGPFAGTYKLNVTGTNGFRVRSTLIILTVVPASPTLNTSIKDSSGATVTSVTAGTKVHDTAIMNGGSQPTGSVAYLFFSNGACTAPGTSAGTVSVTNGVVPDSSIVTPLTPGSYSFIANYSGDANNNKAVSSCEPLNVTSKLTPTLATAIKDNSGATITTVVVGTTIHDTATLSGGSLVLTGTVTYFFFTNNICLGPPSTQFSPFPQTVSVGSSNSVPASASLTPAAGLYSFNATYSGDSTDNPATSLCEPLTINKQTLTITTAISPSSTITVGASVTDQATLTGGYPSTGVTGSVTYAFFSSGVCSGNPQSMSTVSVGPGNFVPVSASVTPPSAGSFAFNATYSGDTNNTRVSGTCEPLSVMKTSPTITTVITPSTIIVGGSVTDQATLTGGYPSTGVTGTVMYAFFSNGGCTGTPASTSSVTVGAGDSVPPSGSITPLAAGSFAFNATYIGDSNNNRVSSICEPLTVNKATPSISTAINPSSTIIVGSTVTDQATLTGGFPSSGVTGSVVYAFFSNGACTGLPASTSTVPLGTANAVPVSASFSPSSSGTFAFNATYTGDPNNNRVSSSCEPLTVTKQTPFLTTAISPSSTITVGASVTDHATLTGGFPSTGVTGSVIYAFFNNGACNGSPTTTSTVTIGSTDTVPVSTSFTPSSPGSFAFNATYGGDTNNNRVSSACEPLIVNKQTPTISTTINPSPTITVGTSVTDQATLTGGFPSTGVTGSVIYAFFSNSACTGIPTTTSTVTIGTGGSVPASTSVTPPSPGSLGFNATYTGDTDNNRVSSVCEPLSVQKTTPSISTSIKNSSGIAVTSIVVGNPVHDTAVITGATNTAGGTVTYDFYNNGICNGLPASSQTVSVASVAVPDSSGSTPTPAGSYSYNATYSGDSNNQGAKSSCEPLNVIKATPTITSSLSAASIVVGQSASDSATISGFYQAGGTVSYNLFIGSSSCSVTGSVVSTVTVTNGLFLGSRSVTFNSTNPQGYSWSAVYSGDSNNNGATSACEPLTVNPTSGVTITTSLSSTSIVVGNTVTDSATISGATSTAGGSVTYIDFPNGNCGGTGSVVSVASVVNSVVLSSRSVAFNGTGSFSFDASYSGDSNNAGATSVCEPLTVQKASPSVATNLLASTITVGNSATDSATLSSGYKPSGTVTYEFFTGPTCAGTAATVGNPVTVSSGTVPNSAPQTFSTAGSYSWNAVYNGDSNNNGATSSCEPFTVNKANPTLTTILSSSTPVVGTTVTDSASLTGGFNAGGSVSYLVFANGACTGTGSLASTVQVTNGLVANSRAVSFNATGSFAFQASYGGDVNNNVATSSCEPLTVQNASPIISTSVSSTSVTVGQSASDSATISNGFKPSGTVQYELFANSACTSPSSTVSIVTITSSTVPSSRSVVFNATGSYSFQASYTGDLNNNPAISSCEPFTVVKTAPTISTSLSSNSIVVGSTITDSSALTGALQATGSVVYSLFSTGTCAGTPTVVSTVTVTNNLVPDSRTVQVNATGSWSFNAAYSGDSNNAGITSPCEPFTVTKTSPTLTTTLSASTITVGNSVFDSAALSGSFQASGTVTYDYFSGSTCAGTATAVGGAVTVTNGIVPNSASQAYNTAGPYSFQAIYSGDAKNSGTVSTCEPLTVNPSQGVTVTTAFSPSSPIVGGAATDSATLSGTTSTAGGTVAYTLFSNGACTSLGNVVSTVNVASAVVPNSRAVTFNNTGTYAFQASYSGDANNNPATSACEPLTVAKTSPTITTSLSSTTITVGTTASDSASLSSSYSASGTVTYEFFAGSTCTGTPTTVGTPATVTNNLIPSSAAQSFNSAGPYSWNAIYSGDSNNNGATSACEPLTVTKVSADSLTTNLSSTAPLVGSSVTDSATLTNSFQAIGTVTYTIFANSGCTGQGTIVSAVTVAINVVPNSRPVIFNATQSYSFNAIYSGDSNNNPATSSCEPLSVQKASPTVATLLSASTIVVGNIDSDSATMSGGYNPSGTVSYEFFTGTGCTGTATAAGSAVTVTSGNIPNSPSEAFNTVGSYSWNAIYSGDSNNNGATSQCEPLTVTKASPTISTILSNPTPVVGTSITDSATLNGGFNAGGTVAYSYFGNGACTGSGIVLSVVTVSNGVVPTSGSQTFGSTGTYSFNAVYSGDGSNNGTSSACEPLTVQKANPSIGTLLSSTSIKVGQSVTDSATLASSYQAQGTVTYEVFANGGCTSAGVTVSTVAVAGGIVPNSRAVLFNSTGSYSFLARYNGDNNNAPAISGCEPLAVNPITVSLSTNLSSSSITVGTSVFDSGTLQGATNTASGTVTYTLFGNGNCAAPGLTVSVVTISNGAVPNSNSLVINSTGTSSFNAVYSGDTNNSGATSACEPFTVNRTTPTIVTSVSTNSIVVGNSVFDTAGLANSFQAGGSVTYTLYANNGCTAPGTIVSVVAVNNNIVANSANVGINSTGSYSFQAGYSGDANNSPSTSICEPFSATKANPTISTSLSSTSIQVGGSVSDSATLTGAYKATGTVTYQFFAGSTCTGTSTTVGSPVVVNNGIVPGFVSENFNAAGSYSWNAVYSGDSNNSAVNSLCEPLTISKASPAISTVVSSSTPTVGTSVTDTASLTNSFNAGGTVTYSVFSGSSCATGGTVVSTVTVAGGSIPNSRPVLLNATGSYSFSASYNGDNNNNGAASQCEPLTVQKTNPTITTTLSSTSIQVDQSVTDSVTPVGFYKATGTVTYYLFTNNVCNPSGTIVSTVTVTNNLVPVSRAVQFNVTGSYSFDALYSGDSNNNGSTSACEPLTVSPKGAVTITTSLSSSSIIVGGSAFDSATLAGSTSGAGGTVTYYNYPNGNCLSPGTIISIVSVTSSLVPSSRPVTFNGTGTFSFNAAYSGDTNNGPATSSCEQITVQNSSPSITTALSSTTITVGGSATDSAVIAGGYNPTSSVTYEFFTGTSCSGTATTVGVPVTISNGIIPNSGAQTFNRAGSYSWNAVYSGDANNNANTSPCEPLTVQKASPTVGTSLSSSSFVVGTTATDSATISGGFNSGGTVTYSIFTNNACNAPGTFVSIVTVVSNSVPNSRPVQLNSTGSYSFNAVYSGDSNNNAANSQCEPLTVIKANPSVTTKLSPGTTVAAGTTIVDQATLSGGFPASGVSGTVTYYFFGLGDSSCNGLSAVSQTVGIGVGNSVPSFSPPTITAAGQYSFNAAYNGDANNNAITSSCEPLTVSSTTPTVTTSLSATTVNVGGTVTDSAILTQASNAGGTVTYSDFNNGGCLGVGTLVSTVSVTNGNVPNSRSVLLNATGAYSFEASYSGDSNNSPATSSCEPLTVQSVTTTITTKLSSTSVVAGGVATDSATLTGSFNAGGTVAYNMFPNGACTGTSNTIFTVTVASGTVPNSRTITLNNTGTFSFNAVYSGDSNNSGATSQCEPLTVVKTSPSITTAISPASTITIGQSIVDSATIDGAFQGTGTVTYYYYGLSASCTGSSSIVSTVNLGLNNLVPNSGAFTLSSTGSVSFNAVYSGDSNNSPATSACEPLTALRATPQISASLSAATISAGQTVTVSATLTGGYPSTGVTGIVTYYFFSTSGTCTGTSSIITTVSVGSGNNVPSSPSFTPPLAGTFGFNAAYGGDANNNGNTASCHSILVNKATPSISTMLSSANVPVGGSVLDSAAMTGSFQASGLATYEFFPGSSCIGTPTTVGASVTVTNNVIPNSGLQAFNSAGSYSWNLVYSGDANNIGVTSSCEPLSVLKASPTITTSLSSNSVIVGNTVTDSAALSSGFIPGGSVTYSVFLNSGCTGSGAIAFVAAVTSGTIGNSRPVVFNATSSYGFQAVYSGDPNNNGSASSCEVLTIQPASPTLSAVLSGTVIQVGQSVSDSATLSNTYQAGGTVTYSLFVNNLCAGTGTSVSIVVVANTIPSSRSVVFNSTGSYSWQAGYTGDSNNLPVTSGCEPMSVVPVGPTITTSLSTTSPIVGTSATDAASLQGTSATASGTVTYTDFANGNCANTGTVVSIATVSNGAVSKSRAVTFNSTGFFSFDASYSGDSNNKPALSSCELLTVIKASPAISTTLSAITTTVGGSTSDSSSITGGYNPTGSVTYEFFTGTSCSGTATTVGVPVTLSNGIVPNSSPQTFNAAGSYSWNAVYSGDSNNNVATSSCEPLAVAKTSPTLATVLSSTGPVVGTSVYDSATLSNGFNAGGTVSYFLFTNGACSTSGALVSTVSVTIGSVQNSRGVQFNLTGTYSFEATYSGDSNNNGGTSTCEPMSVQSTSTSITSLLSANSLTVGAYVTDSAIISGSYQASGTVTYRQYASSACAGSPTVFSTVTVTNGVVPNSSPSTLAPGSYSFSASYSGDNNNGGSTSTCEPFTVNKAIPNLVTALSASSITVDQSVIDSSTLSSYYQATGTVSYSLFVGSNTCTGPRSTISTVIVSNGVVPSTRSVTFNATNPGGYSLQAAYSGDGNNAGATSACEPLVVSPSTGITLTTVLSSNMITVGGSVFDTASLHGTTATAGGAVTYSEFSSSGCVGQPTLFSAVTVANGAVPNSPTISPGSAGSYSFIAAYSGDSNNSPATSSCEQLTVGQTSPAITTTLSSSTIGVGASVSDSATMTSFYKASGTVIYNEFAGNSCSGVSTTVSTVTVTNGNIPISSLATFNTAGNYSWSVAYSGDVNNLPASSPCESLTVKATTPTIVLSLSADTINVGGSVTISSTLAGGYHASGSVTYGYVSGSTCTGVGSKQIGSASVANGVVSGLPPHIFPSAGLYEVFASYGGDQNNVAKTSNCVQLTVTPILSTPSSMTVTAGSTVQFTVNATDPDQSQVVTLTPGGLPSGASFSSVQSYAGESSSKFTWTPSSSLAPGDYNVTFTAAAGGVSTSSQVTIRVLALNKTAPLPIVSYSIFGIVGFLAVLGVALLLRRYQNPRRKLKQ